MTAPRLGSLALDGRQLEAAWWGPGPEEAPSLVLLHEGLGSVSLWRDWPARLAEATGCGVVAYARFGYGRSDPAPPPWPLTYMHDEARVVLPRVLDAAAIRRCVLVGHSDGGSIAAIHAGTRRDPRVAGLVLLAPHFVVEATSLVGIRAARDRWETTDWRARLARHHRDPEGVFRGWNGAWLDPDFPRVFDLRPELARIRVPVLVVQGEADPYGTVEQLRIAERHCPGPVEGLVLPGVGHAPQQEGPVLDAVREFLARIFAAHTVPER